MVPLNELEEDATWGARILPPETTSPWVQSLVQSPCQGAWQQEHGLARTPHLRLFVLCRNCPTVVVLAKLSNPLSLVFLYSEIISYVSRLKQDFGMYVFRHKWEQIEACESISKVPRNTVKREGHA